MGCMGLGGFWVRPWAALSGPSLGAVNAGSCPLPPGSPEKESHGHCLDGLA